MTIHEIGLSVKRLQARHHRAIDAELTPLGISLSQWDALRHLSQNPDASLHDLAQLTFQSDQSFGTLASRMIDRGVIVRLQGPGRAVRHGLTDKGLGLKKAGDRIVEKILTESFAALSASELVVFSKLLARILDELPSGERAQS